jgi:DNA-binding MarR family transcriptional regulator
MMDVLAPLRAGPDLGYLSDSLGFLLRIAQLKAYESFFEDLGAAGLKPGEYSILSVIGGNPGVRQGLLGQSLRIKRAHMTKIVRSLEDRGLVTRHIPDDDRRSVELTLTAAGRDYCTHHRAAALDHESRRPAELGAEDLETLKALLRRYVGLEPPAQVPESGR